MIKMASHAEFRIWQWNCRGILSKRGTLQQFVRSHSEKPQVILLQETLSDSVTLPGYKAHAVKGEGRGIATLVSNKFTFVTHDLGVRPNKTELSLVEVIPSSSNLSSIFILNIYSSPSDHRQRFRTIIAKATRLAGLSPLVVAGDFNSPFRAWNYPYDSAKGRSLWQETGDADLSLITDPMFPTRRGTSTTRDSTPDLAFVKNAGSVGWENLLTDLGSDHYITVTKLQMEAKSKRKFTYVDWDKFRESRSARAEQGEIPDSLGQWTEMLLQDVRVVTRTIETEVQTNKMDSRLAHLLEAKQSLLARWKGQRLNRRLRKKIAELNTQIEEHCKNLSRQQWDEICNSVDGQMRTRGKWNLLKHLLDESGTKSNQRGVLARILHLAQKSSSGAELLGQLAEKYLPLAVDSMQAYPGYMGTPCAHLDEPFTISDVRRALHELNGRSAPGPDRVTNKALRNLEDDSVEFLTDEINRIWKGGDIPEQWKLAKVILIPKPGKAPSLDNLRPISLTSCVGKVVEHVVQNRIADYIEHNDLFPHYLIGFRPGLCTQDAMKIIKCQILDNHTRDTRAILGLDIKKAFDNVRHDSILDAISSLNLGSSFHAFVRSFLCGRKAILKVGDLESDVQALGNRGTPQGSVLSPLLFNIVMAGLSRQLSGISDVGHTIYADDITIWCRGGSDGTVEAALQEAIDTTESFLEDTGLSCSPEKSELLLYKPVRRGRRPRGWVPPLENDIHLRTKSGRSIPKVASIRILGMTLEATGTNTITIKRLEKKTDSVIRLIRRVANRRTGLSEDNLVRLIHAFLLCHFAYVAAMHVWKRMERDKLNAMIRRAVKNALGLPNYTHTNRLLQLGIHNTLEEIAEAQERTQVIRLSGSKAGRMILAEMGIPPAQIEALYQGLTRDQKENIIVSPAPRNMHPQRNVGRRRARARALLRQVADLDGGACFVDAAQYDGQRDRFTVVAINHKGITINAASVCARTANAAEQVAIALALLDQRNEHIFSDSRAAIRAFSVGAVCKEAKNILGDKLLTTHTITWFPAHMGNMDGGIINLNELAHSRARGLAVRGHGGPLGRTGDFVNRDPPTTYNEITQHFAMDRRIFPPPHAKLNRAQALTLRLLQTETYPNPAFLHKLYPDVYLTNSCTKCGGLATLHHMLWECPSVRGTDTASSRKWDSALRSPDITSQLWAVQRAHDAALGLGLTVPSWERPAVC